MICLEEIRNNIDGDIVTDISALVCYATDASVYKELPIGVIYPRHEADIVKIVLFARKNKINLIVRAAGTSLAGQVVGNGLIVDISRYLTRILEINLEEQWAIVEPGVVRDELNRILFPSGLFFAPETATSNRCCIGGMLENNSCGANSLIYGSTRRHVLSVRIILSDASQAEFVPVACSEFQAKCEDRTFEGGIYRTVFSLLSDESTQQNIRKEFPDKAIQRRSMGYD